MAASFSHSDVFKVSFAPPTLGALRERAANDYRVFWVDSPRPAPPDAMVELDLTLPAPFAGRYTLFGAVLDVAEKASNVVSIHGTTSRFEVCIGVPAYEADDFGAILTAIPQRRPCDRKAGLANQRVIYVESMRCYSGLLMQEFYVTALDISQEGAFVTSSFWFVRDETVQLLVDDCWITSSVTWNGRKYGRDGMGLKLAFPHEASRKLWLSRLLNAFERQSTPLH